MNELFPRECEVRVSWTMCFPRRMAWLCAGIVCLVFCLRAALPANAQQPTEPVDINPLDGEMYYLVNQLSGMQMDLDSSSTTAGASIVQNNRSFTSLSQRWAFTKLPGGQWAISNLANGLCLDSATSSGTTLTVQNPCAPASTTQQWSLTAATNGYVTLLNQSTGLGLDVSGASQNAGAALDQTAVSASPTQNQQWLLRPVFFRGVDNALLEKQESERVAGGVPWWQDAGQTQDVLQMLKNHGVNMVRVRPTSAPPYTSYTSTACTDNGCYAETDPLDINLAKRAKQLGMAVELTLLFDGGSSTSIPGAWSSFTLTQAESALYSYVKSEVEAYRSAGVIPDMVTIGNEVDTGFLGSLGSPTGNDFGPFAALEQQGMQAVLDASSDPSIGAAVPPPIRCIHITPAWDLTSFFGLVNSNSIPYDAMCQSYYPLFHGPLTTAQAATSNPNNQPIEETALMNAATSIGKPIFVIEAGEHYENGFDANDPWYPTTVAGQRQFLIDLNGALKGLPDNLGMGFEYWDPEGVNIPNSSGGYTNGDGKTDGIFSWNGLTLFDNADTSGKSVDSATNYSAVLQGVDALGGRVDPTLAYKLVNVASTQALGTAGPAGTSGVTLSGGADDGDPTLTQQWKITSNGDGYFQVASLNTASGGTVDVLDTAGSSSAGAAVSATPASAGTASQEWNVVTTGGGTYAIVNKSSGLVLAASGSTIVQQAPASTSLDWITPANQTQQWNIIPVHITGTSAPGMLQFDPGNAASVAYGSPVGTVLVDVEGSNGSLATSPSVSVTLTITGPGGFSSTSTTASSNGVASFNLSSLVPPAVGSYSLSASAAGLTSASATLGVAPAVLMVTAQSATRAFGVANPAFTYSIMGFVGSDTQAVVMGSPVLSTTATTASAPGSYSIAIQAGTLAATNYSFVFTPGTLTVTTASTTTTLVASNTSVTSGQSIVLTATITSATGAIPAGMVTFLSGITSVGTGVLNASGVAMYTVTSLPPGVDAITASYAGSADFATSASAALSVTEAGFTLSASPMNVSIAAGGTGNVALTLTPVGGYTDTIAMSCTSPMAGVTCAFTPATYTANGSNAALTGSVTLSASSTAILKPLFRSDHNGFLAAVFFPFGSITLLTGLRRKRSRGVLSMGVVLLFLLATGAIGVAGCSGGGSNTAQPQGPQSVTGTVTVTATGAKLTQSINLTVTVP
jgi:arabinogalactan endo-1,4-beta-galactosidase